jgi:hypothetical protein
MESSHCYDLWCTAQQATPNVQVQPARQGGQRWTKRGERATQGVPPDTPLSQATGGTPEPQCPENCVGVPGNAKKTSRSTNGLHPVEPWALPLTHPPRGVQVGRCPQDDGSQLHRGSVTEGPRGGSTHIARRGFRGRQWAYARNSTQQCAGMGHGHTAPLRTASAEVIHALVHVVSIATETRCPRAPKQAPTMTLGLEMSKGMIGQRGTRVGYLARLSPFAGILEGRCRCPPAVEKRIRRW